MTPSISPKRDKRSSIKQTPSSASSFSFIRLPPEVLELIVTHACRSPPASVKETAKRSPLALDISITLSLSLTSKSLHALISPLLLENVRLTRPSSLIELNRTLESNPALGELIKSLHVGTENDSLAAGDWPLLKEEEEDGVRLRYPVLWIKTSFGEDEEGRLPKWCEPDRSWSFEPGRLDCQGVAVANAIKAAMDALDVEPYKRGYARSGEKIGLELWCIRIYELQGCLDLFLAKMRRIEEARGYDVPSWRTTQPGPPQCPAICRLGRCGHYPRLVLTASRRGAAATTTKSRDQDISELTRSTLWKHLTRRGSDIDHFEHPVIFAATGLDTVDAMGNGRSLLIEHLAGPYERDFTAAAYGSRMGEEAAADSSDEESDSSSEAEDDNDHDTDKPSKSPDLPTIAKNHNLPGLVGEFHILLNKTPNLLNLSLNGYFHIGMPSPVFSNLQSLSLGPLLPFWPAVFNLAREEGPPMFEKLENLRVCGELMQLREAELIAGAMEDGKKAFPVLKRVQWEAVEVLQPCDKPLRPTNLIYERVRVLQGLSSDPENSGTTLTNSGTSKSRLIEIRLHPSDVTELFEDVSTAQMHSAWQHGSRILAGSDSTPHRVLVTESGAAKLEGKRGKAIKALHVASRQWWEDCAMLVEGSKVGGEAGRRAAQEEEDWMPGAGGGSRVTVPRKAKGGVEEAEGDDEEREQAWTVSGWRFE